MTTARGIRGSASSLQACKHALPLLCCSRSARSSGGCVLGSVTEPSRQHGFSTQECSITTCRCRKCKGRGWCEACLACVKPGVSSPAPPPKIKRGYKARLGRASKQLIQCFIFSLHPKLVQTSLGEHLPGPQHSNLLQRGSPGEREPPLFSVGCRRPWPWRADTGLLPERSRPALPLERRRNRWILPAAFAQAGSVEATQKRKNRDTGSWWPLKLFSIVIPDHSVISGSRSLGE
jgi:hypothetical protein